LPIWPRSERTPLSRGENKGKPVMKARFCRLAATTSRAEMAGRNKRACVLGLFLSLSVAVSASAQGTPEQRKACTPDVYRLCAGDIPNVRAITACLRRQKTSLSEACRTAFNQADH
jgi:hypothetical protein